jgi:hypothetical protein
MSMRIVDTLEPVDVEKQHGHGFTLSSASGPTLLEAIVEQAPIRRSRHRVVMGESALLCQRRLEHGDFLVEDRLLIEELVEALQRNARSRARWTAYEDRRIHSLQWRQ